MTRHRRELIPDDLVPPISGQHNTVLQRCRDGHQRPLASLLVRFPQGNRFRVRLMIPIWIETAGAVRRRSLERRLIPAIAAIQSQPASMSLPEHVMVRRCALRTRPHERAERSHCTMPVVQLREWCVRLRHTIGNGGEFHQGWPLRPTRPTEWRALERCRRLASSATAAESRYPVETGLRWN